MVGPPVSPYLSPSLPLLSPATMGDLLVGTLGVDNEPTRLVKLTSRISGSARLVKKARTRLVKLVKKVKRSQFEAR